MSIHRTRSSSALVVLVASVMACSGGEAGEDDGGGAGNVEVPNPLTDPEDGPPAGNQNVEATCDIPPAAGLADASDPTTVVGDGTPESCTGDAFVQAVAQGGVITFDCGSDPVVITLSETAKIVNDTGPDIVIDGGALLDAVEARGYRCEVEGCGSTHHLQLDHNLGWALTQTTELDDMSWLCGHDHDRKTRENLILVGPVGRRRLVPRTGPPPPEPTTPKSDSPPNLFTAAT